MEANENKDLDLLVQAQQSEIENLQKEVEQYRELYYQKIDEVNELREFLNHITGLIKLYVK